MSADARAWADLLSPSAAPPRLCLVLGGARSGKSRLAERLTLASSARLGRAPCYIATATAGDDEMARRIAAHRARRGPQWRAIEAPLDLPAALRAEGEAPVLADCLTLWLSNLMLAGRDWEAAAADLAEALAARAAPCVLVTNEVGLGLVPETPLGRAFRDAQGWLNQRLAEIAHCVVFVAAGLPLVLKGGSRGSGQ
jgi:adenosyl cobinamide kinase/adenosyl cobinamide phosphate guanylyltransferase